MDHAHLTELVQVLENVCLDEAVPFFSDRRPPGTAAGMLFRLLALDYVRLHPEYRAQQRWFERVHLAAVAWRMTKGRGSLPRIHPEFPDVQFEQLEEPLGRIQLEIYQPLNRLIETSAASYVYALANRGNWTVIESVRGLALIFPVGLYLLRWASAGREPTVDDMVNLVVALDRGQGYASLMGWQQRFRIRMLARLVAIESLIAWYAR